MLALRSPWPNGAPSQAQPPTQMQPYVFPQSLWDLMNKVTSVIAGALDYSRNNGGCTNLQPLIADLSKLSLQANLLESALSQAFSSYQSLGTTHEETQELGKLTLTARVVCATIKKAIEQCNYKMKQLQMHGDHGTTLHSYRLHS